MNPKAALSISLLSFVLCAPLALAKVTEAEAARLGEDLTPLGAEVAGEGEVPAWTGGLTGVPKGIKFDPKTEHPPNPYPDDKVKYTITRENMGEYDALLTDGHKAMLKRVPGFKMNVYQSRRSCTVPKFVAEATKRNATTVELTADGEGVTGGSVGTPFPIPQSAKELMWNHRLRYVPYKTVRYLAMAPVVDGKYELVKYKDRRITFWTGPDLPKVAEARKVLHFAEVRKFYPPRWYDISIVLTHGTAIAASPSVTWRYVPVERRIRRFPPVAYDTEAFGTKGLTTVDSLGGFSGALDRYDWENLGRRAQLIPYNSYDLIHSKYAELIKPSGLNPDSTRYEPHRVWVVEAKLRKGQKHLYSRRVLFIDEDMLSVVAGELYDSRGKLQRVQELHTINFFHVPACMPVAELVYDVQSEGRYLAASLLSEEKPTNPLASELDEACFNADGLVHYSGATGRGGGDVDRCDSY
ncbi:MAG: DUF1329 domain-containing protein [Micropepsaceae bacterium]